MYFNWFPLLKTSTIEVGVVGDSRSDERCRWWWFISLSLDPGLNLKKVTSPSADLIDHSRHSLGQ